MRRIAAIILLSMVLSSCSSFIDNTKQATQAKFQQIVASQFGKRLERGIDLVIEQLTMEGGYLDDPMVRILLPPPFGIALGIVRGLQINPQATLLQTLINQAAENTIPVAGPVLKNIVMNMTTANLEKMLSADNSSATDYLKEQSGAALQTILLPAITEQLHANGAIELYSKLLQAREIADQMPTTLPDENQQRETTHHQAETIETVKAETIDTVKAETIDTVKAETIEPVKAETIDTVKAETIDTVKAETIDTVKPETIDTVKAETLDPVKAETLDTVKAETLDPVKAETIDTVKAETIDTVKPETIDTVKPETMDLVKPEQLGQYVVEQAISGLFKKVAEKELSIRTTGDIDLFKTN